MNRIREYERSIQEERDGVSANELSETQARLYRTPNVDAQGKQAGVQGGSQTDEDDRPRKRIKPEIIDLTTEPDKNFPTEPDNGEGTNAAGCSKVRCVRRINVSDLSDGE